jgi:hypothetical protein
MLPASVDRPAVNQSFAQSLGSRLASDPWTRISERRIGRITTMSAQVRSIAVENTPSHNTSSIPSRRSGPVAGDVLASERTARADVYAISVVPGPAQIFARRYPEAIERVRELARQRGVDGWFTGDQTHYASIARYRADSASRFSNDVSSADSALPK